MPTPTLVLDTVARANIQQGQDGTRITRTGFIRDIDTTVPPEQILATALSVPGMPPYLDPYPHPSYSNSLCRRRLIDTIPGVNTRLNVMLLYDTGGAATPPPSTFILSRSTTLVERETEVHPKDWSPLAIKWTNPRDAGDVRKADTARMRFLAPFQRLIATGYYIGTPPTAMTDDVGKVNSTPWRGYAKGTWLYAGETDKSQDLGLSYNIQLEFWRKPGEDWRSLALFRDEHGQNLPVSQVHVDYLKNGPYTYGTTSENGIIVAGLYDLADFSTTFGF
jgi:hypothetical protein